VLWIFFKEVPGVAGFVNNVAVVVENANGEFVAAQNCQTLSMGFDFGSTGPVQKRDVVGYAESVRLGNPQRVTISGRWYQVVMLI
jgi:hypothetical protein